MVMQYTSYPRNILFCRLNGGSHLEWDASLAIKLKNKEFMPYKLRQIIAAVFFVKPKGDGDV
ncbi:hypothetical protein BC008_35940 [Mastigocoleus testarum BC008]|uniref:Uncharacterized protein n=1 Tax=Mastigocoleus testarum BC008 TaxID=371196 RepID=A0A0V7ZTD7_9CYAN|nr:hypothetical protein BC008_30910 [Mastigocoleus testarum BC008]KST69757.1 hypothetical protein BC008_35940 [Mastigocoleus testarum BC008]